MTPPFHPLIMRVGPERIERSQMILNMRRYQMETFSALMAICAGNSPVPGEFPSQRPVTRSFGVFFDLRLNKRLSKQSWGWWFETLSCPLWRHCDAYCQQDNQEWTSRKDKTNYNTFQHTHLNMSSVVKSSAIFFMFNELRYREKTSQTTKAFICSRVT